MEKLADLRIAYAKLLRNYEEKLGKSPEAQEEFVKFLPRLFRGNVSSDKTFQFLLTN